MKTKVKNARIRPSVSIYDGEKRFTIKRKGLKGDDLLLSIKYQSPKKDNIYSESLVISRGEKLFDVFDKHFSSYDNGTICFDSTGAHTFLSKTDDEYRIMLMREFNEGERTIKSRLYGDAKENEDMNALFKSLTKKERKPVAKKLCKAKITKHFIAAHV